MNTITKISAGGMAAILMMLAGCESMAAHGSEPALHLQASRSSILVNESATVFAQTENTLGKDAKITWDSSLGKVTPQKQGILDLSNDKPTALFTSDKPGTAVITATVTLANGEKLSDSVNVTVNPVQ